MRMHIPRGRPVSFAVYCVFGLTLTGCQGCPKVTLKTVELTPSDFGTALSGFAGSQGWCLSSGNVPPSPFSAGGSQVMVGFDNFFRPGSNPFPCHDIRAALFRGLVVFDLGQFDSAVAAELLFDAERSVSRDGGGENLGSTPAKSFATELGVALLPRPQALPHLPADNEASLPTTHNILINVSGQVNEWLKQARPNHGFVLLGPTGPVDVGNMPRNNDAKLTWYGNFKLRVIYNPALNPRAPQ